MNLGEIIQSAMDKVNEQTNPSSGKWSLAWWTRQVNRAKDVLAQKTGYRLKRHILALTEGTQYTALPSTLCWGILSVKLGTTQLDGYDPMSMDNEYPGWRYQSNFPNQPAGDDLEVVSSSALDVYLSLTIKGTNSTTGAYASVKGVVLNGTTSVDSIGTNYPTATSSTTKWDEIYYVEVTSASAWAASTAYTVGDVATQVATNTTRRHRCTVSGTSGTSEPTWASTAGSTATDGTVTWAYEGLVDPEGTVTIREASANATITTIAAGSLSSGTDISMNEPSIYVVSPPNIEWYSIPDANYTAFLFGGELPSDFTTASGLSDTQAATGLPGQYHYLLAEGAATLALLGDLSADSQDVRMSITGRAFYNGIDEFNAYLASISRERTGAIPLEASLGYEHFDLG